MANYYQSWQIADLNNATMYSSDVINNPDWYTNDDMCPLAKCKGLDILNYFDTDIINSFTSAVVWTSNIIMIANAYYDGSVQNYGLCIRFATYFEGGESYLRVTLGQGNHNGFSYYRTIQYSEADYRNWAEYQRKIYIVRKLKRSTMADEGAPNYTGKIAYYFWFGGVALYTGSFTYDPSVGYEHMVYTRIPGLGDPAACLLSIPCSTSTIRDQSEGVYSLWDDNIESVAFGDDTKDDFHLTDAAGEYDPDPADPTDPNIDDPEGPSGPGGGQGTHDRRNDTIGLPSLPGLGALDGGMITLYELTAADMANFFSDMWSFWEGIKAYFADPLDFIMGCMIMPFSPFTSGRYFPKFGADTWNYSFKVVSQQYFNLSLGMIDIDKYYDSCFDWDPYQKIQIFIPYVGYRELPVDQVNGKTIQLTYHIDCMSGEFVAFVHTPNTSLGGKPQVEQIICQFAGTMGVRIPLHRQSFDNMVSAGINLLGGAVGMAAGGLSQAAGLEGGDLNSNQIASQASAATVSAVNAGKRNVIRSGSIGADAGYMSSQRPFIIRTLPRQSLPVRYMELEGYPCNMYGPVADFTGFVAVEMIKLRVNCTEPEKEMIEQLMRGGVYI